MRSLAYIAMMCVNMLVQACSLAISTEDFEPSDLSSLAVGAPREEIESLLGKPIKNDAKAARDIKIYSYDKGGAISPPLTGQGYLECWGLLNIFCEPILTPIMLARRQNSYESQQGQVAIRYGPNDTVMDVIIGKQDLSERDLERLGRAVCGDSDAQYEIGDAIESGRGVRASDVDAYKWYAIAASADNPLAARVKDLLVERMSPDQITEAERLAEEWEPGLKGCKADTRSGDSLLNSP